ncbi:MAG TPA: hypothetical protein VM434_03220 [Beijerinckiaceae bacterium]|nr:hypothetical protein [Beijerinckiaceae bacterium]
MPRYFFDVRADEMVETDAVGADLACVEAVEDELTRGVAEILRGAAPHGAPRSFEVAVRDAAGRPVVRASLSIERLA